MTGKILIMTKLKRQQSITSSKRLRNYP